MYVASVFVRLTKRFLLFKRVKLCKRGFVDNGTDDLDADGDVTVGGTLTARYNFQLRGGIKHNYTFLTGSYTLQDVDYTVECQSGSFTVTLPNAVVLLGQLYNVKNSGSGTITLSASSSQLIDGDSSVTILQKDCVTIQSNGIGWIIV